MVSIKWCINAKNGLELVEPSSNLGKAYLKKAEDSLKSVEINTVKEWKITTAYYSIYFSLYAILMKIGIKCEIHSCTIEFAKHFLKDYFNQEDFNLLGDSFKARIDTQYYVDKSVPDKQYERILKQVPLFHIKCKEILSKISEGEIKGIRERLRDLIETR